MIDINDMVEEAMTWFHEAPEDHRREFLAIPPDDVQVAYHFSLGVEIRNHFNLWANKWTPELVDGVDYSPDHPDAISGRVVSEVHRRLTSAL